MTAAPDPPATVDNPATSPPTNGDVQLVQINFDDLDNLGFSFAMVSNKYDDTAPYLKPSWILLDSESTCFVFCNRDLVHNIRPIPPNVQPQVALINGGQQTSKHIATVRNFGDVWFNPNAIANIISLAQVRKVCRITMDTDVEAALLVHRKDGSIMKFIECERELYYFDCAQNNNFSIKSKASVNNYSFVVTTVEGNKTNFTHRELKGAEKARKAYALLNRPAPARFINSIHHYYRVIILF